MKSLLLASSAVVGAVLPLAAPAAIERVPGAVEVIPDTAFKAGWTAYLEGRNLTDERYISSVAIAGVAAPNAEIFNPGTGRAVYSGLRYNW